jgi:hypothetical protein
LWNTPGAFCVTNRNPFESPATTMEDEVIVKSGVVQVKHLRSSSAVDKESTTILADFFQVIRKSHVDPIQFDKRHSMNITPQYFFQKRTTFRKKFKDSTELDLNLVDFVLVSFNH